jgi:primary-amine oxidase
MFDYQFFLDGAIGVEVRASGYIQSAYYANNEEYGFHIHDKLSGSMHDHVLNYKVDFDILGTKNSVATTEFIPAREKYSWSGGKYRDTMKLRKGWIESEDQGKIDWDANGSKGYVVVNKEEKNKFGEYRGYKLLPGNITSLSSLFISSTADSECNSIPGDPFHRGKVLQPARGCRMAPQSLLHNQAQRHRAPFRTLCQQRGYLAAGRQLQQVL